MSLALINHLLRSYGYFAILVAAAMDAVAVDGEEDRDAVSGAGGDLSGVSTTVQP